MAVALPRPVQLKLDQTLAQWKHWQCEPALTQKPVISGSLPGGISNYSVLVGESQRFVVRIDGVNPIALGLNRQAEWHAMHSAHKQGLAPVPRYFNPELGCLVSDYLCPDPDFHSGPEAIAELLSGIHALPRSHHRLDQGERILRYERKYHGQLRPEQSDLNRWREAAFSAIDELQQGSGQMALCHNDLLAANRIASGGRLYAIDWEYCAMGDPLYDLAVVICGDELDASESGLLIKGYLDRPANHLETHRLKLHCGIYRYLEMAWYLTAGTPTLDKANWERKLRALAKAFN
jgi:thiamine kinase-like enzyme